MSTQAEIPALTALEIVRSIDAGDLTAAGVARALIEQIAARDPRIDAWAHFDPDAVRAAAAAADASPSGALLRGLPFAAKDNIDTHDMPTAYGSGVHVGKTPARDAACVALMRLAGAVLMGKTVTTEFAHRHPGPTRNPHDPAHTPGGSSSGSAAAVAAGMVPVAFGSQTTGSVIRPAAYCGVVGYKPTHGDFNLSGMLANTPSFDTLGVMSRSLDDVALVRAALHCEAFVPVRPAALAGMRIGLARTPYWSEADEEARVLTEDAARALAAAGAVVSDFEGARSFADLHESNRQVSGFEFARTMSHERLYALDELSAVLREGRMQDGFDTSHAQYVVACKRLERARVELDEELADLDVLISLPAPGAAPAGLGATGSAIFNMPWTTLHAPTVTLPLFTAANGLPIGLQVIAARHRDAHLLACAAAIEQALN